MMDIQSYLSWLIEFAALYARKTAASDLPQVNAGTAYFVAKRVRLREVQAALQTGATITGAAAVWYEWVRDTLPTYQNNPRENEAENTAVRIAAATKRDAALMPLERWIA